MISNRHSVFSWLDDYWTARGICHIFASFRSLSRWRRTWLMKVFFHLSMELTVIFTYFHESFLNSISFDHLSTISIAWRSIFFLLSNPNCSPLRILSQLFLNRQIIPTVRNRSLFPLSADVSPWCSPSEHQTKISFFEPSERISNFDWQDKKNDPDVTFLSDLSRRHPMRALRTIFIDEFNRAERRFEAMERKRRNEIQAISILFFSSGRWHLKSWKDERRIRSTYFYRSRNGEPKSETRYKERIESVGMISIGDKWSFVSICWGWRRESNGIVLVNLSAAIRWCRGEMRSARCRQKDERFLLLVPFSQSMNESLFRLSAFVSWMFFSDLDKMTNASRSAPLRSFLICSMVSRKSCSSSFIDRILLSIETIFPLASDGETDATSLMVINSLTDRPTKTSDQNDFNCWMNSKAAPKKKEKTKDRGEMSGEDRRQSMIRCVAEVRRLDRRVEFVRVGQETNLLPADQRAIRSTKRMGSSCRCSSSSVAKAFEEISLEEFPPFSSALRVVDLTMDPWKREEESVRPVNTTSPSVFPRSSLRNSFCHSEWIDKMFDDLLWKVSFSTMTEFDRTREKLPLSSNEKDRPNVGSRPRVRTSSSQGHRHTMSSDDDVNRQTTPDCLDR